MAAQRLDKIIASTGRWSRREVKDLVRQGRVTVDDIPARSAEEKAELKKALKEVEKFEKEMNKTIEQVKHKNTKVQSAKYNKDTAINRNKGKEIEKERD